MAFAKANFSQGTRTYQSTVVLRSLFQPIPQDYMDDIESFFYVFYHTLAIFQAPHERAEDIPSFLERSSGWDNPDPTISGSYKVMQVHTDQTFDIPSWWGPSILQLFREFRSATRDIVKAKDEFMADSTLRKGHPAYAQDVDVHFNKIKASFDKAIEGLEAEGLCPEEIAYASTESEGKSARQTKPATSNMPSTSPPSRTGPSPPHILKRRSEDEPEGEQPPKRRRSPRLLARARKQQQSPPSSDTVPSSSNGSSGDEKLRRRRVRSQ